MNKNYIDYVRGGYSYNIVDGKGNQIVMPPKSAKDTSKEKEEVSTKAAKDNTKNMVIQASTHKCRGINGKTTNRILRDGRDIKVRKDSKQQEER